jgi:MFS superfamily sulfate permease-like transporter
VGSFVYIFLGSVPSVTVGPTTLMSIMTQKHSALHPGYAPFLSFCSGIIILTGGILRLGTFFIKICRLRI